MDLVSYDHDYIEVESTQTTTEGIESIQYDLKDEDGIVVDSEVIDSNIGTNQVVRFDSEDIEAYTDYTVEANMTVKED